LSESQGGAREQNKEGAKGGHAGEKTGGGSTYLQKMVAQTEKLAAPSDGKRRVRAEELTHYSTRDWEGGSRHKRRQRFPRKKGGRKCCCAKQMELVARAPNLRGSSASFRSR